MRKRESLNNYVKDNRTNEIVEEVKYKPIDSNVIGKTKITLTNVDTNEEDVVAESENIITDIINKYSYATMVRTLGINHMSSGRYYTPSFFETIVLTNSKKEESVDTPYAYGKMIGKCDKLITETSDSPYNGVFNKSESFFYDYSIEGKIRHKLVYDFPTHAANGPINSVFWLPESRGSKSSQLAIEAIAMSFSRDSRDASGDFGKRIMNPVTLTNKTRGFSYKEDNKLRTLVESDKYYEHWVCDVDTLKNDDIDSYKLKGKDGEPIPSSSPSISHFCFIPEEKLIKVVFFNNYNRDENFPESDAHYFFIFDYEGNYISSSWKKSSELKVDIAESHKINPHLWFYNEDNQFCCFDVFKRDGSDIYEPFIITFDDNLNVIGVESWMGELVKAYNLEFDTDEYKESHDAFKKTVTRIRNSSEESDVIKGITVTRPNSTSTMDVYIDPLTSKVLFTERFRLASEIDRNDYIKRVRGTGQFFMNYYNRNYSFVNPFVQPTAHNKLPTTIEKTDSHTMKVEYEFIIDDIFTDRLFEDGVDFDEMFE